QDKNPRHLWPDLGDSPARQTTPRPAHPAAPRQPTAPRGSARSPSLVAGVCFLRLLGTLRRFRLGTRLRLRRGLGPLLPVLLLLASPLVIGDVEPGAFENKTRPARHLPLCPPAAPGALPPTLLVHPRRELL